MTEIAPTRRPPLSVLDLVPVGAGSTAAAALAASVKLARPAERARLPPGLGRRAPQHAGDRELVSAGAHRAPRGGDRHDPHRCGRRDAAEPRRTRRRRAVRDAGGAPSRSYRSRASAARRAPIRSPPLRCGAARRSLGADEFPAQLRDLFLFFDGTHPQITAVPGRGYRPAVWMLGSSDFSAQVAGVLGLPFSFAHHFASHNTVAALEIYRDPSARRPSSNSRTR